MNDIRVYGIGYYGSDLKEISKHSVPGFSTWHSMMCRCYSKEFQNKNSNYKGCTVCDEWHNLSVFSNWYLKNYYTVPNERMELDKDILVKGNKIYSPTTCVFVPQRINTLFVKSNHIRGKFPIGVYYDNSKKKYIANLTYKGKNLKLARCVLPVEAFFYYKFYKEELIREVAREYKVYIPEKLYEAMLNWEVEITD